MNSTLQLWMLVMCEPSNTNFSRHYYRHVSQERIDNLNEMHMDWVSGSVFWVWLYLQGDPSEGR